MRKQNSAKSAAIYSAFALAAILAPAPARAADGVNVQNFSSNANTRYTLLENGAIETPRESDTGDYRRYFLGLDYSYLNDPLVVLNADHSQRVSTLVDSISTIGLTGGMDFGGRFTVNLAVPVHFIKESGQGTITALGDARVFGNIFLTHRLQGEINFSLIPELRLPTGSTNLFVSDGSLGLGVLLAAEIDFGGFSLVGNTGYRYAGNAVFREIDFRNRVPLGIGANIPVGRRWAINVEGNSALSLPLNSDQNPSELYAGGKYYFSPELVGTAGASMGALNSVGSQDYRLLLTLKFIPRSGASDPTPIPQLASPPEVVPEPAQKAGRIEPKPEAPLGPRVVFTARQINISEEIKFEHDSDVLTRSAKGLLDEVAGVMKQNRKSYRQIEIDGHTNDLGSDAYNLRLSRLRAASVRRYLVGRGINHKVLASQGFGKRRPKRKRKELSLQAWRAENRRVEFKVVH